MWQIKRIEEREAELDFSSSGGGRIRERQLFLDDVLFANGVGLTKWSGDSFQVMVCEECGCQGCRSGGWLSARMAGELLVFVPAVDQMASGEANSELWAPPEFMVTRGAPILDPAARERLSGFVPTFSDTTEFKPLVLAEAIKLMQLEAPAGVLGNWRGTPRLDRDRVVASDVGEVRDHVRSIEEFLARGVASPRVRCTLRRLTTEDDEVSLALHQPQVCTWNPLVARGGVPRLRFSPDLVLEVAL